MASSQDFFDITWRDWGFAHSFGGTLRTLEEFLAINPTATEDNYLEYKKGFEGKTSSGSLDAQMFTVMPLSPDPNPKWGVIKTIAGESLLISEPLDRSAALALADEYRSQEK